MSILGTASFASLRSLSLRCRAINCFSGPCAARDEYVTDSFGGASVSTRESACDAGEVVVGLGGGRAATSVIRSVRALCAPLNDVKRGEFSAVSRGAYIRGLFGRRGKRYERMCAAGHSLIGLDTRSNHPGTGSIGSAGGKITGIQAVCSKDPAQWTPFFGGTGGVAHNLRWPSDFRSIGVRAHGRDRIELFSILCAPDSDLTEPPVRSGRIVEIHGSYRDAVLQSVFPGQRRPFNVWPMPLAPFAGSQFGTGATLRCPTLDGEQSTLTGLIVAGTGGRIYQVGPLLCQSSGDIRIVFESAGQPMGSAAYLGCEISGRGLGRRFVDGMLSKSGDALDGLALHCGFDD